MPDASGSVLSTGAAHTESASCGPPAETVNCFSTAFGPVAPEVSVKANVPFVVAPSVRLPALAALLSPAAWR